MNMAATRARDAINPAQRLSLGLEVYAVRTTFSTEVPDNRQKSRLAPIHEGRPRVLPLARCLFVPSPFSGVPPLAGHHRRDFQERPLNEELLPSTEREANVRERLGLQSCSARYALLAELPPVRCFGIGRGSAALLAKPAASRCGAVLLSAAAAADRDDGTEIGESPARRSVCATAEFSSPLVMQWQSSQERARPELPRWTPLLGRHPDASHSRPSSAKSSWLAACSPPTSSESSLHH
jgi:hypothetical protein